MLARLKMHEVCWCVTFSRTFSTILTKNIPIPPHFFLVDTKKNAQKQLRTCSTKVSWNTTY